MNKNCSYTELDDFDKVIKHFKIIEKFTHINIKTKYKRT
jgi:hypothetical protein